jgi:hypothetical protein
VGAAFVRAIRWWREQRGGPLGFSSVTVSLGPTATYADSNPCTVALVLDVLPPFPDRRKIILYQKVQHQVTHNTYRVLRHRVISNLNPKPV